MNETPNPIIPVSEEGQFLRELVTYVPETVAPPENREATDLVPVVDEASGSDFQAFSLPSGSSRIMLVLHPPTKAEEPPRVVIRTDAEAWSSWLRPILRQALTYGSVLSKTGTLLSGFVADVEVIPQMVDSDDYTTSRTAFLFKDVAALLPFKDIEAAEIESRNKAAGAWKATQAARALRKRKLKLVKTAKRKQRN